MPSADLGHEGLEAITARGRGAGVALILVDDGDGLPRPPQGAGARRQILLPRGAGGVFAPLEERGLPDVDASLPLQMRGTDRRRGWWEAPALPPEKTAQCWTLGLGPRPS